MCVPILFFIQTRVQVDQWKCAALLRMQTTDQSPIVNLRWLWIRDNETEIEKIVVSVSAAAVPYSDKVDLMHHL